MRETVEIKLELPADLFDESFRADVFTARIHELAILELVRAKRMHEHEAGRMLGIGRWELVKRMEQAGIAPTEQVFDKLKGELDAAINARQGARPGSRLKEK